MAEEKKEAAPAADAEAGEGSKKKKKLFIIIGGAVGVLAIGGGAAFFFLAGGKKAPDAGHGAPAADGEHGAETAAADAHGAKDAHAAEKGHEAKDAKADPHAGDTKIDPSNVAHGGDDKSPVNKEKAKNAVAALVGTEDDNIDFGCTTDLKPFHLNLGNPLENRFMRMEVTLEYPCTEETRKEIERRMPQLRDAVVAVASRKTREFLLSPDGKDQLRLEMVNRINHYMSREIKNAYITDILIE
jgi:flagellar FliL protein